MSAGSGNHPSPESKKGTVPQEETEKKRRLQGAKGSLFGRREKLPETLGSLGEKKREKPTPFQRWRV
jgi:hypothetical protein